MSIENPIEAFHGPMIHSLSSTELEIIPFALVLVTKEGKIAAVLKYPDHNNREVAVAKLAANDWPKGSLNIHSLAPGQFLMPGLVDTHNHAPQWAQRGLGQGMQILDWLDAITFPNEARFHDPDYARRIYSSCVDGFLRQGVTTASYYGSVHGEATKILSDICLEKGQRALVGKCNMSRNAPDYYRDESIQESLRVTDDCIAHIRSIDPEGELVKPVLTPRFAISCHSGLLKGLGRIAKLNPDLPIQTHFNEAEQEIEATRKLFPEFTNEADLYEHYGLLNERSILAHCCHMTDYEMERLKALNCGVAHCPISNMTVGGGFMAAPIREFMRRGIKVGLGTDSGGGFSSSMLDAMRQAMIASNARVAMFKRQDKKPTTAEVTSEGQDKKPTMADVMSKFHDNLKGLSIAEVKDKCQDDLKEANLKRRTSTDVLFEGQDKGLTIAEVFHLATLGGAEVCSLADKIGNFEVGKDFDALIIGTQGKDQSIMTMVEERDSLQTVFEKFIMTGDDRNIVKVYVNGRLVMETGKDGQKAAPVPRHDEASPVATLPGTAPSAPP